MQRLFKSNRIGSNKIYCHYINYKLKDVETNLQFHEILMKKECNMIKDGEVEFKDVHEKLHSISRDLDVLHLKSGRIK